MFTERNLEIFFAAIVKGPTIQVFDIEDIENQGFEVSP